MRKLWRRYRTLKPVWQIVIGVFLALIVVGASAGSEENKPEKTSIVTADSDVESAAAPTTADTAAQNSIAPSTTAAPTTTAAPATTAAPTTTAPPPTTPPAPAESVSQRNARRSGADYLDFAAFSRSGLIEQLEYEGFSSGDATYAVDALGVDWNEQAAKSAAEYLDFSAFSRSGLIEQLVYEGFTQEQAAYGVSSTGL